MCSQHSAASSCLQSDTGTKERSPQPPPHTSCHAWQKVCERVKIKVSYLARLMPLLQPINALARSEEDLLMGICKCNGGLFLGFAILTGPCMAFTRIRVLGRKDSRRRVWGKYKRGDGPVRFFTSHKLSNTHFVFRLEFRRKEFEGEIVEPTTTYSS